jgi:acetolactate decarboxylase
MSEQRSAVIRIIIFVITYIQAAPMLFDKRFTQSRFKWSLLALGLCAFTVLAGGAVDVRFKGSLRAVHGGDVRGTQVLAPLMAQPGLLAVGPVAQLDGEITAVDGKLHVSKVTSGKQIQTNADAQVQAAFLVWAHVEQWTEPVALGKWAKDHADLEDVIEQAARRSGIDTSQPFPFKLIGTAEKLEYHVLAPVAAKAHSAAHGDGAHHAAAAADHKSQAVNLKISGQGATLVGFYSSKHEGVFTHRGSRAHLHVVDANGHTGHVDEISTPAGLRIAFALR